MSTNLDGSTDFGVRTEFDRRSRPGDFSAGRRSERADDFVSRHNGAGVVWESGVKGVLHLIRLKKWKFEQFLRSRAHRKTAV